MQLNLNIPRIILNPDFECVLFTLIKLNALEITEKLHA